MKKIKNKIAAAVLAGAGAALIAGTNGCSTAIGSSKIIAVTERGFGLRLAQQTQNQTPEVLLGFFSTTVELIPTSTNAAIQTPDFANTFSLGQSGALFVFDVNETTATGRMQAGAGTNIASQPIIPK